MTTLLDFAETRCAMGAKVLIFDFDGTIADTFDAAFEILNSLAEQYRFRPLQAEEIQSARDMGARELMRFLGISATKVPFLSSKGTSALRARISEIQPIPGVCEMLRQVHAMGLTLGIITSNTEENVERFVREHGIEIFSFVRTSSRLFGKAHEIKSVMRANRYQREDLVFIGDEARDIEAAKKAGIVSVAVTWGYNSERALRALCPESVVHHPNELTCMCSAKGLEISAPPPEPQSDFPQPTQAP